MGMGRERAQASLTVRLDEAEIRIGHSLVDVGVGIGTASAGVLEDAFTLISRLFATATDSSEQELDLRRDSIAITR